MPPCGRGHVARLGDRVPANTALCTVKLICRWVVFHVVTGVVVVDPVDLETGGSVKHVSTVEHCQLIDGDVLFDAAIGLE